MRNNDLDKRKLYLGAAGVLLLVLFGYFVNFLMGRISFLEGEYLTSQKGLLALEQKQKQATLLRVELSQIQDQKKEILGALLGQQYEDKLQLIVQIEDAAKNLGLAYELRVVKELAQEEIDREKELLARSRRGSQRSGEEEEVKKLPGITFEINLTGSYEGFTKFFEKLQALPYYMQIERFNILRKAGEDAIESKQLEGALGVTFFAKE